LQSIPWNFYAILSLVAVPTFILMNRDFGPMAKAEYRAETTGQLIEEGATPLSSVEEDLGKPFKEERSEEHTSELQSRFELVCRLLLEKKKQKKQRRIRG